MSMNKMFKKVLAVVAAGAMTMGMAMPTFAADEGKTTEAWITKTYNTEVGKAEKFSFTAEQVKTGTGIITTDAAKDILLQPGESTEVEVLLTWINSGDNLGKKVNVAEISKDYNEFEAPDIDSTPDNQKPGEDDIDDAPVILSVQTGEAQRYIGITAVVLVILAGGITLIKKFVL